MEGNLSCDVASCRATLRKIQSCLFFRPCSAIIMDSEKLINLVHERKYLWDQKEPQYHMRNVTKLWNEVAAEMKEPSK